MKLGYLHSKPVSDALVSTETARRNEYKGRRSSRQDVTSADLLLQTTNDLRTLVRFAIGQAPINDMRFMIFYAV